MFQPVSKLPYLVLDEDRQILVCVLCATEDLITKWKGRACVLVEFTPNDDVCDVVRDLLANPQIRAVVFEGDSIARTWFDEFWKRESPDPQGISVEHLELVRQFVDLYDGECCLNRPMPPFYPRRLRYEASKEETT